MPNTLHTGLALLVFCIVTGRAHSTSYFVSESGDDRNRGVSWDESWRTLKRATEQLTAGDTVVVRKSTEPYLYGEVKASGTALQPIVIKGESSTHPPTITGAVRQQDWSPSGIQGVWTARTSANPIMVVEDGTPITRATTQYCVDGKWTWKDGVIFYRPTSGDPTRHEVWRASMAGGLQLLGSAWVIIEDFECWLGQGACILINGGHNNTVRRVRGRWYSRGIEIRGGQDNLVEDCEALENREGIYLLAGANRNTVRRCKALRNGNLPLWRHGDRGGIAIGESGINSDNILEHNEVAFNGGPNSDPGLIVYRAPRTRIANNHIYRNFGSGMFVTISSDDSVVIDNLVSDNGFEAQSGGYANISGLSLRRSKRLVVQNNTVIGNHVAPDSQWEGKDRGPRGGLDVRGNEGDDMTNILLIRNQVCGTVNGPDIYVSPLPDTRGLAFIPSDRKCQMEIN